MTVVDSPNPRWRLPAVLLVVLLVTLAVFAPTRHYQFVYWDDQKNIVTNPLYQPSPAANLTDIVTSMYFAAYNPVVRLAWAGLADVGSSETTFNPAKYHLANVVVHLANVVLVLLILRLIARNDWAAGIGALLFAVHPLQVEPVAWVTGMKDLLYSFFGLLALLCYLRIGATENPRGKLSWSVAASLCFFLSLLTKATAVVLPPIAVIIDALVTGSVVGWRLADIWSTARRRWELAGAWALVSVVFAVMSAQAEQTAHVIAPWTPLWQRPFVASDAINFYLEKLVAPVSLIPIYGRAPFWVMSHPWCWATPILPVAVLLAARKSVWSLAAFIVFVVGFLPDIGLMPFAYQYYSTVADRYAYLSMLGPCLALAAGIAFAPRKLFPLLTTIAVLGCGLLAFLSTRQIPVWANTQTLFHSVLALNPRCDTAHRQLGLDLEVRGDLADAIVEDREALRLNPAEYPQKSSDTIDLKLARDIGSPSDVIARDLPGEEALVRRHPAMDLTRVDLAKEYLAVGRLADARREAETAMRISENHNPDAQTLLIALRHLPNGRS